jgi:hypothetical protein
VQHGKSLQFRERSGELFRFNPCVCTEKAGPGEVFKSRVDGFDFVDGFADLFMGRLT